MTEFPNNSNTPGEEGAAASTHRRLLNEGIDLFNKCDFFECHEVLEQLWNLQTEPDKQFTQGLIQIAVAFYHLKRNNLVGARKLFSRGMPRIQPYVPTYKGYNVADFYQAVSTVMEAIQTTDAATINPPKFLPKESTDRPV